MNQNQSLVLNILSSTKKKNVTWSQFDDFGSIPVKLRDASKEYYLINNSNSHSIIQEWNLNPSNIYYTRNKNFKFYIFKTDIIYKFWDSENDLYNFSNADCIFLFAINNNDLVPFPYPIGSSIDDDEISELFSAAYNNYLQASAPDFSDLEW